ncbi:MAG: serine hydrolase domain-containing protein [Nocardioides sp.]
MGEGLERHPRAAAGGVVGESPVVWAGDPEAPFQIGSVTKVFTSLLLATYVVDGSLRLDHRVGQLVPDLAGTEVGDSTLEQLATHTSGLPRIPRELWRRALTRHPDPYADLDHERLVASLVRTRLRPRSRPAYSNLGAGLLGHAIATWAGRDLDALVQQRICLPLGLTATTTRPAVEPPGHHRRGGPYDRTWHFVALAGAGGLWSTLDDQLRFLTAQLEPPPGDLGAAVRLTQEVRVPGSRLDQCLGWMRLHGREGTLLWHNGGTAGYRSFVGVQNGSAVAVVTACDRSVDAVGVRLLKDLAG